MRLTDTISIRLIKRIEIEPDEIVSSYAILFHLILSYLIRFLQLVVLSFLMTAAAADAMRIVATGLLGDIDNTTN